MLDAIRLSLGWWYGAGWAWVWRVALVGRLRRVSQSFSMPSLVRTLGAPYRQTFAVDSGVNLHGLLDNLVSRVVGLFVRVTLLLAGSICGLGWAIAGGLLLVSWGFIPLVPILGVGLTLMGWAP